MNNADRLRQAADKLDMMAVALERMHIEIAANPAALLRAVADEVQLNPCHSEPVVLGGGILANSAFAGFAADELEQPGRAQSASPQRMNPIV